MATGKAHDSGISVICAMAAPGKDPLVTVEMAQKVNEQGEVTRWRTVWWPPARAREFAEALIAAADEADALGAATRSTARALSAARCRSWMTRASGTAAARPEAP